MDDNGFEFETPEGYAPSIAYEEEISDPDVMLDPANEIVIRYDYPLRSSVQFTERSVDGFTAAVFLSTVRARYAEMYSEEKRTSTIKEGRVADGWLNRNETNGTYGIIGHDIDDLTLDAANKNADGTWSIMVCS
jgi:hypothetical protein